MQSPQSDLTPWTLTLHKPHKSLIEIGQGQVGFGLQGLKMVQIWLHWSEKESIFGFQPYNILSKPESTQFETNFGLGWVPGVQIRV